MTQKLDKPTDRRKFLRGALGVGGGLVALATGCKPEAKKAPAEPRAEAKPTEAPAPPAAPTLPDGLDENNFYLHTRSPLTLETKRSALGYSAITPTALFFVRNNLPMPDESIVYDPDRWQLKVEGVKNARTISVAELKQMAFETIASVIQCSGNGRKFFEHGPSGSQWATGAAGCAMWTGVRVSDVVEKLGGALPGKKYLTATGGEEVPKGVDPDTVKVERSVPIEKGLKDCMLVWEMNGQPIPITHGGPLRLIVPGYYGCNQIKYIKRLAFTEAQTGAKIQKTGYRFRDIGQKGTPTHPSMWRMNVKSWINGPGAEGEKVLRGQTQFYGVALSGERTITKVEYSFDEGKTWKLARLVGPDLGTSAWRAFTFTEFLENGLHKVYTRATDSVGDVQPEIRPENERGYGNNGWRDHGLDLTVVPELPKKKPQPKKKSTETAAATQPTKKADLSPKGQKGKEAFAKVEPNCGACHTLGDAGTSGAVGPNLDELKPTAAQVKSAVTNGVGAMPPYKGNLSAEEIELIATYVSEAVK
jgi:DMSO/TMAO reductase YedYZ molybdopterin-dependent catalytic subunit/cytochrome c553